MSLVIYHNPSCATSRKVLGFIRAAGIEPSIHLYLKEPLSKAALTELLAQMKIKPRALLRRRGTPYDALGLGDESLSDAALIDAMVKHPLLIERPIVTSETTAVLCRPPERVYELLPAPATHVAKVKRKPDAVSAVTGGGATKSKTHLMRASLDAKHFREFELPSAWKLYDLAQAIVTAFGFDFDHAFGFYSKISGHIYDSSIKYELFVDLGDASSGAGSVKKTSIMDAFPAPGATMTFLFDYGDDWQFKAEMIDEGQKQPKLKYPKLLKSVGKAPEQYPQEEE